ncbi:MAG: hypothetical protein ACOX0Z_02075 [Candidatus Nanosyncoccaceae bacterium]|jgi:hypothetical protein
MPSTTQTLSNGTHTINPTSANASNPQLDLPANTWGYRLNNTTFGTTTTIETNVPNSQYTWAQVQQSTTPDLIYTGTGNHTFPVYYGLKASHTQASGTYTGTVTYTATTQ